MHTVNKQTNKSNNSRSTIPPTPYFLGISPVISHRYTRKRSMSLLKPFANGGCRDRQEIEVATFSKLK